MIYTILAINIMNIQAAKKISVHLKCKIIFSTLSICSFQYCDNNIGRFSIASSKVIALILNLLCVNFGIISFSSFVDCTIYSFPTINSNSFRSFSLFKALAISFQFLFASAFKNKSDNYMGSNIK